MTARRTVMVLGMVWGFSISGRPRDGVGGGHRIASAPEVVQAHNERHVARYLEYSISDAKHRQEKLVANTDLGPSGDVARTVVYADAGHDWHLSLFRFGPQGGLVSTGRPAGDESVWSEMGDLALCDDGRIWIELNGLQRLRPDGVADLIVDGADLVGATSDCGAVLLSDTTVHVLAPDGELTAEWSLSEDGHEIRVEDLTVAADDTVYMLSSVPVEDSWPLSATVRQHTVDGHELKRFSVDHLLEARFTDRGSGSIAVGPGPIIYVHFPGNAGDEWLFDEDYVNDVFVLDGTGKLVEVVLTPHSGRHEYYPRDMATDKDGRLLLDHMQYGGFTVLSPDPTWRMLAYPSEAEDEYPVKVELDASDAGFSVDWDSYAPAEGLPTDGFMTRTYGNLVGAGGKRIRVVAEGGMRLWIGDTLVTDDWSATVSEWSGTVMIGDAGMPLMLEFIDRGMSSIEFSVQDVDGDHFSAFLPSVRRFADPGRWP